MEPVEELRLVHRQFHPQSISLNPLRQLLVQVLHVAEPFPNGDTGQGRRILDRKNDRCDAVDCKFALVQVCVGYREAVNPLGRHGDADKRTGSRLFHISRGLFTFFQSPKIKRHNLAFMVTTTTRPSKQSPVIENIQNLN